MSPFCSPFPLPLRGSDAFHSEEVHNNNSTRQRHYTGQVVASTEAHITPYLFGSIQIHLFATFNIYDSSSSIVHALVAQWWLLAEVEVVLVVEGVSVAYLFRYGILLSGITIESTTLFYSPAHGTWI